MIQRIGFLDWGIGGLSVFQEFIKKNPKASTIYFSDSGFKPYGKVPAKELITRLDQVVQFFKSKNITTVVIACNAASTVIKDVQKINPDVKLVGMLEAGLNRALASRKKSFLVVGGQRTIESQFFQKQFKKRKLECQALVAQPLSALIEKGQQQSTEFRKQVLKLNKKLIIQPSAVLLACTHYPAATSVFQEIFSKAVILDPAVFVVKKLPKNNLKKMTLVKEKLFFTTGSVTQSKLAAFKAFNLKIDRFVKIKL